MYQILPLAPNEYVAHPIHTRERDWAETNCYVDIWIELLKSHGHEPLAALAFTLAIDFEGDQWTFFKFPLADLTELYGLDVQELAVWKPLTLHIEEQVGAGKPVLVELDSYFLPDTAGVAYKIAHVKSTVAINEIDLKKRHLGYFHGQSYYHLDGEDFERIFHLDGPKDDSILPPYVEIVKHREDLQLDDSQLLDRSLVTLKKQLSMLPEQNPFSAYKKRLADDLQWLMSQNLEAFHQYSFATLRQFGSCFELAACYIDWLSQMAEPNLEIVSEKLKAISEGAKIYQFQLARAVTRQKALDLSPMDALEKNWQEAMELLKKQYG